MKTNEIMIRKMGKFHVTQRTSDGMFNATELIKQWNSMVGLNTQQNGDLKKKDIDDYLLINPTKEFICTISEREGINSKLYKSNRGRYNGGTWMHPMLFMDFAMWLSPYFKYDVLKFVSDQMIKFRNEAGDAYRDLAAAVKKIVSDSFMPVAMSKISQAINFVAFNSHSPMERNNHGEESEQRELLDLERSLTMLINEGFIRSYDQLINYLRKKWQEKYQPKILQS